MSGGLGLSNGVKCPVCRRTDGIDHVERRIEYMLPPETRYNCRCGCEWVNPPRIPPLDDVLSGEGRSRLRAIQLAIDAPSVKPHEESCAKCGARNPQVEYLGKMTRGISTGPGHYERTAPTERLQLTCGCGHFWFRPTLDGAGFGKLNEPDRGCGVGDDCIYPSWKRVKEYVDDKIEQSEAVLMKRLGFRL